MATDTYLLGERRVARRPELDFQDVTLRHAWEGWSEGTRGVVVDAFETEATVEIADHAGRTLALLSVPYDELEPVHQTPGAASA